MLKRLLMISLVVLGPTFYAHSSERDRDSGEIVAQRVLPNTRIPDFNHAKKLLVQVFSGHEETFYCPCTYDQNQVDIASCGFKPVHESRRSYIIEWDHIVPAAQFGRSYKEWREGDPACVERGPNGPIQRKGRRCAEKVSKEFRMEEADMYNLEPAIGELNAAHSNYPFGTVSNPLHRWGECDFEVENHVVQVGPEYRGVIARTYLYMNAAYPNTQVIETSEEMAMFRKWDKENPTTEWERTRAERIEQIQGNHNPFIK